MAATGKGPQKERVNAHLKTPTDLSAEGVAAISRELRGLLAPDVPTNLKVLEGTIGLDNIYMY
jgi:hypothetical protein